MIVHSGKSKIQMLEGRVSGEDGLPGLQISFFSLCHHRAEKARVLVFLLIRALTSLWRPHLPYLLSIASQRSHLQILPMGIRASAYESEGTQTSSPEHFLKPFLSSLVSSFDTWGNKTVRHELSCPDLSTAAEVLSTSSLNSFIQTWQQN